MAAALVVVLAVVQLGAAADDDFLRAHNDARAQEGVPALSWNNTLAAFAQSYSKQQAAGSCAHGSYSGGPYGENVFWSTDASPTAADVVALWVAGRRGYDYKTNSCRSGNCRTYIQVIWRDTTSLGCAKAACRGGGGVVMACEYFPPGDIAVERPY